MIEVAAHRDPDGITLTVTDGQRQKVFLTTEDALGVAYALMSLANEDYPMNGGRRVLIKDGKRKEF